MQNGLYWRTGVPAVWPYQCNQCRELAYEFIELNKLWIQELWNKRQDAGKPKSVRFLKLTIFSLSFILNSFNIIKQDSAALALPTVLK